MHTEEVGGWHNGFIPKCDRDDVLAALRKAAWFAARHPAAPPYIKVLRADINHSHHELYTADRAQVLDALRNPIDPTAALRAEELPARVRIDIDNLLDRHTFSATELLE